MNHTLDSQRYESYTPEDHETWSKLIKKASLLHDGRISKEYLDNLNILQFDKNKIENLEDLSRRMYAASGWELLPVSGLILTQDFFYMLINKKYPITVSIRKPHEIDFSEQPDIFHDIYGHLPLLLNEKFMQFITTYSQIAIRYVDNEKAVEYLGRLYWYTYEMGLIKEDGDYKPYGAAIITSAGEIANSRKESVPKHHFDLDLVFRTPYNPFDLQKEYFIIDSFDDLCACLDEIESQIEKTMNAEQFSHIEAKQAVLE
jgi:monomeric phenylalanine-4-hydroxylase